MKMTTRNKQLFLLDFQRHMSDRGWNFSDLAKKTGINQGQVSRIAAGKFKTFASNVVRICIELEMNPFSYHTQANEEDQHREAIANSAIAIWDGTPRDREVVVALLRQIADLRKHSSKRRK